MSQTDPGPRFYVTIHDKYSSKGFFCESESVAALHADIAWERDPDAKVVVSELGTDRKYDLLNDAQTAREHHA